MKKKPKQYRVRNWCEYNAGLKQRGSITFWLDEKVSEQWLNSQKTGKRGASNAYSDVAIEAIETVITLKSVYGLAGRQAVGLVESIFKLMNVELAVPGHSTLSRRIKTLALDLPVLPKEGVRHIAIDATGIKIYGEGEWKTRQHGVSKRRTWRKLHLVVDASSGEILAAEVSLNDKKDAQLLAPLLDAVEGDIDQVSADGAYDTRESYDILRKRKTKAAIPSRKDAKIWQHGNCKQDPYPRDQNLRLIRKHGRPKWKRLVNYHRRSLAETTMFCFKTIFSATASSRLFSNQIVELTLKCKALNKMIVFAKPQSYCLA